MSMVDLLVGLARAQIALRRVDSQIALRARSGARAEAGAPAGAKR